ncbi:MAG: hypothetical protein ABI910_16480 [Gemmatimonadota bacterium]
MRAVPISWLVFRGVLGPRVVGAMWVAPGVAHEAGAAQVRRAVVPLERGIQVQQAAPEGHE